MSYIQAISNFKTFLKTKNIVYSTTYSQGDKKYILSFSGISINIYECDGSMFFNGKDIGNILNCDFEDVIKKCTLQKIEIKPTKMSNDEVKLQNIIGRLLASNELSVSTANKIFDGMFPKTSTTTLDEIKHSKPKKKADIYDGSICWSDEHVCTENCDH